MKNLWKKNDQKNLSAIPHLPPGHPGPSHHQWDESWWTFISGDSLSIHIKWDFLVFIGCTFLSGQNPLNKVTMVVNESLEITTFQHFPNFKSIIVLFQHPRGPQFERPKVRSSKWLLYMENLFLNENFRMCINLIFEHSIMSNMVIW